MFTPGRLLRWAYASGARRISCELTLDADHLMYEFRIRQDTTPTVIAECYPHVAQAFDRQMVFERELVADGYTLEVFETVDPQAV